MNSPVGKRVLLVAILAGLPATLVAEGQADSRNDIPVSQWPTNYNMSDLMDQLPSTSAGGMTDGYQPGYEYQGYSEGYYDPKNQMNEPSHKPYKEKYRDAWSYQREEFGPNH
ncbi:MAG: hypothetical protein H6999_07525 [Hahellaceae bacterium]|nr:hypothetical protein [Hahellaceae bacterium]